MDNRKRKQQNKIQKQSVPIRYLRKDTLLKLILLIEKENGK